MTFSSDGGSLASASGVWDKTVRIWDVKSWSLKHTLLGHTDYVFSVSFSTDGQTLASGSRDGTIRIWDVVSGAHKQTLTEHTPWVNSTSFSPDGQTLASAGYREIHLWDVDSWSLKQTFTGQGDFDSVSFSPDGQTLASAGYREIHLWDVHTGNLHDTFTGDPWSFNSVAFSPDGNTIAAGGDNTLYLWNMHTGNLRNTLIGHTNNVSSIGFSPDGQILASAAWDRTIRVWDVHTGSLLNTLTGHRDSIYSVALSPDGQTLASGSSTIRVWDVHTGSLLITESTSVNTVVFSPDGQTLASGSSDGTIYLWDVRLWDVDVVSWKIMHTFTGHTGGVESIAFSPDGNALASGSSDGTMLLWDVSPSTTTNVIVRISPDSLASAAVGASVTFSLKIADAENIAGYQATVSYDTTALRYVVSANGDYLPSGAFFIPPVAEGNIVTLAASSLAGESSGDGTLATLTFEVVAVKASTVQLANVLLTDGSGGSSVPRIENAEITEPLQLPEDVNQDGVVNIIDLTLVASNFGAIGQNTADVNGDGVVNIIDLTLVAGAFGNTAAAPEIWSFNLDFLTTRAQVEQWLSEARQLNLTDATFQRGITVLEQLLAALTPKETALLPNYPNPFNPETWIPYQLAEPADVSITIYAANGKLVRTLALGHQPVGIYESRSRAAYWDGRNALGESVASGIYFFTLTAGDFTATRKMLIRK